MDKLGSIIKRYDLQLGNAAIIQHFLRKPRFDFPDFLFHAVDDSQRIIAVACNNDTADHLGASFIKSPAACRRTDEHMSDIANAQRRIIPRFNYGLLDIANIFHIPETAYEILDLVDLECLGSDIDVAFSDGVDDVLQRDAIGSHRARIDVDLIFLDVAADRSDLGNSLHAVESVLDIVVLHGTEFMEIPSTRRFTFRISTFDRIPEHLSQCRGIRSQLRLCSIWQGVGGK